jgi:hypothetical protein
MVESGWTRSRRDLVDAWRQCPSSSAVPGFMQFDAACVLLETAHGSTQIQELEIQSPLRSQGFDQGRKGNARAQAREATVGPFRCKSEEPQASHRDWAFGSARRGWQGAARAEASEERQEGPESRQKRPEDGAQGWLTQAHRKRPSLQLRRTSHDLEIVNESVERSFASSVVRRP